MNFTRTVCVLLPMLACVSCAVPAHETIVVRDQAGNPVTNATIMPYPLVPADLLPLVGGKTSDANGKIEIFDVAKDGNYKIVAPGYETKEIRFPRRDDRVYLLRKKD